jgi:hypothetical protein
MLDGKAYRAHFPDDEAYSLPKSSPTVRPLNSTALREALAALKDPIRAILGHNAASTE